MNRKQLDLRILQRSIQSLLVFVFEALGLDAPFGGHLLPEQGQQRQAEGPAHQHQAAEHGQEIVFPPGGVSGAPDHLHPQGHQGQGRAHLGHQQPVEAGGKVVQQEAHAHGYQAQAQGDAAHPAHRLFLFGRRGGGALGVGFGGRRRGGLGTRGRAGGLFIIVHVRHGVLPPLRPPRQSPAGRAAAQRARKGRRRGPVFSAGGRAPATRPGRSGPGRPGRWAPGP